MNSNLSNYFHDPIQMCEEIWIMKAKQLPFDTVIACCETKCIEKANEQLKGDEKGGV